MWMHAAISRKKLLFLVAKIILGYTNQRTILECVKSIVWWIALSGPCMVFVQINFMYLLINMYLFYRGSESLSCIQV